MKILIVNSYDVGGAANSCIRLHEKLLEHGVEVNLLLLRKTKDIKNATTIIQNSKITLFQKACNKLISVQKKLASRLTINSHSKFKFCRPEGLEFRSYPYSKFDITSTTLYKNADIIHLHWVAGLLDWGKFFKKNVKPVVWTLHDQNPFLGTEHYKERFLGITKKGFPIERIYSKCEIEEEEFIKQFKINALRNVNNLNIVTPSSWLLDCSKSSEVLGRFEHSLIPYGFPSEIFRNYNKRFSRNIFGLQPNAKIILFVADSILNQRKGYRYLLEAFSKINKQESINLQLCAIGSDTIQSNSENVVGLGRISDERLMAIAYCAADIFVIPSLEDNLPNTMIESLLCGTPVIGFPTGGITETIINGVNGILCKDISVDSLCNAINEFLMGSVQFCSETISSEAKEKYSSEKQAKAYVELYEQILGVQS